VIRAACVTLALAASAAAAQENPADCPGLSRHFVLCDAGTDWATAEWEQFGDGAALHLGPLTLDWAEDWSGRDDAATPEVEVALQALLTDDAARVVLAAHGIDRIDTAFTTVARRVQLERFADFDPQLRAWMVAATPDHRIMLILSAPPDFPPEEIEARSREIADMVRPVGWEAAVRTEPAQGRKRATRERPCALETAELVGPAPDFLPDAAAVRSAVNAILDQGGRHERVAANALHLDIGQPHPGVSLTFPLIDPDEEDSLAYATLIRGDGASRVMLTRHRPEDGEDASLACHARPLTDRPGPSLFSPGSF
jgi:hypothetical protein